MIYSIGPDCQSLEEREGGHNEILIILLQKEGTKRIILYPLVLLTVQYTVQFNPFFNIGFSIGPLGSCSMSYETVMSSDVSMMFHVSLLLINNQRYYRYWEYTRTIHSRYDLQFDYQYTMIRVLLLYLTYSTVHNTEKNFDAVQL